MPAHNEAGNLPQVIPELRAAAPNYDLVVIDDGSKDRTATVAAKLGATVVTLPANLGYGGAVQTGFRYAVGHGYDLAVVMDADGQRDPNGVNLLADTVAGGQVNVAVASRSRYHGLSSTVGQTSGHGNLRLARLEDHPSRGDRSNLRLPGSQRRCPAFFALTIIR